VRRLVGNAATLVCLGIMVFAIGALFLPTALGFKRYVITGGSMTGTIPKGSVIYSRMVPTEDLRAGDVITFVPPDFTKPVTHRIRTVSRDEGGVLVFTTRGDFNLADDPWRIKLVDPEQARYSFHIPYVGYALAMLSTRQVRMLLIGLPAIIVALSLLWSLWREAGEELARQEAEASAATPAVDGTGTALALEWDGPDPFDGKAEAELADLRGWWQ
jgi:signal peptidase I